MTKPLANPCLVRVRISNYKSIEKCDVRLHALTILVGRNGSGKSNFLDALRFVTDGLQTSLDHALKSRGGIKAVRRHSTGHPRNFGVHLEMNLSDTKIANYGFEIAARGEGGFFVKHERLRVCGPENSILASYQLEDGAITRSSSEQMPPATNDRLYLVNAAGLPVFRAVYDALVSMGFYNLNPEAMKELQNPDAGELLHRDGGNIASVIARLNADQPEINSRIRAYLKTIVPGITEVQRAPLGPKETLEFRQEVVGSAHPWRFYANSMSDGTLRVLGALVAVAQLAGRKTPVRLVGIEEPETALHPAAAGALMDALREAAAHTQVVVTSHSPDLLDRIDAHVDGFLAVQSKQGTTEIGPVDPASLGAIKDHLYTPGELLRMDQLEPDRGNIRQQEQLSLFDPSEEAW
ncbi:MAG TPA: AAA family ATPase [Phycisphaerae bacterium]|nr:AAA family ATPase [Phycisphaerae bacterium]